MPAARMQWPLIKTRVGCKWLHEMCVVRPLTVQHARPGEYRCNRRENRYQNRCPHQE